MKILMLVPQPSIQGGIPKVAPLLASALCSLGCYVATETWGRHSDSESFLEKIVGRARDIVRIRHALMRQRFDVMVVNTSHDAIALGRDIPLLLATRRLGARTVLQFHGSESNRLVAPGHRIFKAASAWLFKLCDSVVVLSSEEQRQLERFHPTGRFGVVTIPFLSKHDAQLSFPRPSLRLPEGKPVLLFVGRLIEGKGIFDLLNAMPLILERIECHLLVAGDGPNALQAQNCVRALHLDDHVTFAGYLEGEQLMAAYRAARVFVLPTWWNEGFPAVILEAMDAGLPIVTTCIRGIADHLQEGVHALFIPPRNQTVLANTLVRLLSDSNLRARMSRSGSDKVKEFDPESVARRYLDILEEVVGTERSTASPTLRVDDLQKQGGRTDQ